jgi:spore coat polysaccharide biosynthesis protein SpsF
MVLAITQARLGSSRLPDKVLKQVAGQTFLDTHLQRILKSTKISKLVVATTFEEGIQKVIDVASKYNVDAVQGSMSNVLERFYIAADRYKPTYVVRLTSDCPLIDAHVIDEVIQFTIDNNLDYCSNTLNPMFPDGQDVEVFKFSALQTAYQQAKLLSDLEHVTPFIWRNSTYKGGNKFISDNYNNAAGNYGQIRMTLDEPQDLETLTALIEAEGITHNWLHYADCLAARIVVNNKIERNEGYQASLKRD